MSASPAFADAAETWNRRYAGDDYLFGTEPNFWLREHAGSLYAGGRIPITKPRSERDRGTTGGPP